MHKPTNFLIILEAMASGCPVITAHDTACGEVAGDAALLVDPRSVDSIANAIRQLISRCRVTDTIAAKRGTASQHKELR